MTTEAAAPNDPCPVGMRGIVPSLNTPFESDGAVDEASLRRLVERTVAAGCAGILATAVAGEQASLSFSERDRIARIAVETAAGTIPVVVSVGGSETDETVKLARAARLAGADGICCQSPIGVTTDRLVSFFGEMSDAGPDLLMIQDLDWSGDGLPLDAILHLFDVLPRFQCLKVETAVPGPKYTTVLTHTGGRLHISGGWAVSQMLEALARGVHAFIPTAMDAVYVTVYNAFRAGDFGRARELFDALCPIIGFSNQHIDVSIRFFKMIRHREGVFATDICRPPVGPLDEYQLAEAETRISRLLALQERLSRNRS